MDTTATKVILINRFNLPSEILHVIKSYVFYNVHEEKKNHSKTYSPVINDIRRSKIRRTPRSTNNSYWFFMSINREIILNILFCAKCGNYLMGEHEFYGRISCLCDVN